MRKTMGAGVSAAEDAAIVGHLSREVIHTTTQAELGECKDAILAASLHVKSLRGCINGDNQARKVKTKSDVVFDQLVDRSVHRIGMQET